MSSPTANSTSAPTTSSTPSSTSVAQPSTSSTPSTTTSEQVTTSSTSEASSPTTPTTTTSTTQIPSPSSTNVAPTSTSPPPGETTTVVISKQSTGTTVITITQTPTLSTSSSSGSTTGTLTSTATTTTTGTEATNSPTSTTGAGGLHGTARIAVAVVVPVVIVAALVLGLLLYFRKGKKKRASMSEPLEDGGGGATRPAAATAEGPGPDGPYEMTENDDVSGYRGWGSTAGGRKASMLTGTTGAPYSAAKSTSDGGYSGSPPAPYGNPAELYNNPPAAELYTNPITQEPASPTFASEVSGSAPASAQTAPLLPYPPPERPTYSPALTESSVVGAMPTFSSSSAAAGLNRGASNASSNYSAMSGQSDQSDYDPRHTQHYYAGDVQEYNFPGGQGLYYDDPSNPPPVIRDVQARRNTRIETPTSAHFPQQPSSGIAQNF